MTPHRPAKDSDKTLTLKLRHVIPARRPAKTAPKPHMVLHTRVVTRSGGGPDKTILRSAAYLDPAKFQMAAAYMRPLHDAGMATLRERAKQWDCPLWEVAESGPVDPHTVHHLLRICRLQNVAIWHGHDYKSNLLGLLVRKWWPMKLVTTVHGWTWDTLRTKLYYHIDNWCLRRYDRVVTVNPSLLDHCLAHDVQPKRLTLIPNAIEPAEYKRQFDTTDARVQLGIQNDRLVIGVVGRLSIEKGVDRAVRMIAQLRQQHPNAQLHLIGDGPQRSNLEQLTRQLGVSDAIRFWGWQSHPQRFYEAMDMLLLPSHTEGLPNTVLEAMAMGVPVAATDVGGTAELLDHGHCGVILSDDDDTWSDRVAYLLDSTDRRMDFARLARARVQQHYTFRQRMDHIQAIYRRVLGIEKPIAKLGARSDRKAA